MQKKVNNDIWPYAKLKKGPQSRELNDAIDHVSCDIEKSVVKAV